jgi:hypothetical protein
MLRIIHRVIEMIGLYELKKHLSEIDNSDVNIIEKQKQVIKQLLKYVNDKEVTDIVNRLTFKG